MSKPICPGDRVRITSTPCGRYIGTRGRLTAIDYYEDPLEPFHIVADDGRYLWASSVRRCRLQWSDDPGVHALALLALATIVTAALVVWV